MTVDIVAEVGANHDQSLDRALSLIDLAAKAGATSVKFQLWAPGEVYHPLAMRPDGVPFNDWMEQFALPRDWLPHLREVAHQQGLRIGASVFGKQSLDWALGTEPDYLKIAALEASDHRFVDMILDYWDGDLAVSVRPEHLDVLGTEIIEQLKYRTVGGQTTVLHCISGYPTPPDQARLAGLAYLREAFLDYDIDVGLSNHTPDPVVIPAMAVAMGARMIETHFTDDIHRPGPDHHFALNPMQLTKLVTTVRQAELALGEDQVGTPECELPTLALGRRYLYASRDIPAGGLLTGDLVATWRCGYQPGVWEAHQLAEVLGKRVTGAVRAYEPIPLELER